jgi:hypothetical protein
MGSNTVNKILVGLMAAVLLLGGLVTSGPAQAARPERCPYTGCIATTIVASGAQTIQRRKRANVSFKVAAPGNAKVTGFVKMWVVQKTHDKKYGRAYIVDYRGGRGFVAGDRVTRRGTYDVRTRYLPDSRGPFRASVDAYPMRVVRR